MAASAHRAVAWRAPRPAFVALAITLAVSACARPVLIESDPAALAAIDVRNESGVTMIVSFEADGTSATLGAVTPGATQHFIISRPSGTTIRVYGRSDTGARVSGPHIVTLHAGATQSVLLR